MFWSVLDAVWLLPPHTRIDTARKIRGAATNCCALMCKG